MIKTLSCLLFALHWLPIRQRIQFKLLLLVYRCTHQLLAPAYLTDLVVPYVPARSLRSAEQNLLVVKVTTSIVMGVVPSRWLDHPYGTPCLALLGTLCLYLLSDPVSKLTFFARRLSLCCRSLVVIVLLSIRLSVCYLIFIASIIYCLTNLAYFNCLSIPLIRLCGFLRSAYMILFYFVYN